MHILTRAGKLSRRVTMELLGKIFYFRIEKDITNPVEGRVFIQIVYDAHNNKTGELKKWYGRKWYLSEFMLDDEIIKTFYAAYKAAIEHEIMESFKIDGITLFNPHISYEELLKISDKEVKRKPL